MQPYIDLRVDMEKLTNQGKSLRDISMSLVPLQFCYK